MGTPFFFSSLFWPYPTPTGQGWNPSWSCDLRHSCSNAGFLTHCTEPLIKPTQPQRQAGSPINPLCHTTAGNPSYLSNREWWLRTPTLAQNTSIWSLSSPLPSCVIAANYLTSLHACCLNYKMGQIISPTSSAFLRLNSSDTFGLYFV